MKKSLAFLCALLLLLPLAHGCVEESPEPIYVPEEVESKDRELDRNMDFAGLTFNFYNDNTCELLGVSPTANLGTTLAIPEDCDGSTLVRICEEALANTDFTAITIPDSVRAIDRGAFRKCAVTELILPTSLKTLGEECFDGCLNLEKLSFRSAPEQIPTAAFYGCESLKEILLPEGVKRIGEEAFAAMTALEKLTLPESLEEIGPYAFWNTGTPSLAIHIPEGVKSIGKDAFRATAFLSSQTEEFVLVGDGVLLAYHGSAMELTLPETVRYLSNAFDNSSVTTLHLPKDLQGACKDALPDTVTTVTYEGSDEALLALVKEAA